MARQNRRVYIIVARSSQYNIILFTVSKLLCVISKCLRLWYNHVGPTLPRTMHGNIIYKQ